MTNILEAAEAGRITNEDGHVVLPDDERLQNVDPTAEFAGRLTVGPLVKIEPEARIGDNCTFGSTSRVGAAALLGPQVMLSADVYVEPGAILFGKNQIGNWAVVGAGTIVAEGVDLPMGADVGPKRVVPHEDTVRVFGATLDGQLATIYGTDNGARLCINGAEMTFKAFKRLYGADPVSASFLPVIENICWTVQAHYQSRHDQLKQIRQAARALREERQA